MAFIYRGRRTPTGAVVTVTDQETGQVSPLAPRLDLANKSPTGFEWAYGGSGPAQVCLGSVSSSRRSLHSSRG